MWYCRGVATAADSTFGLQLHWAENSVGYWGTVFRPFLINFGHTALWIVVFSILLLIGVLSAAHRWSLRNLACGESMVPAVSPKSFAFWMFWSSRALEGAAPATVHT
jgi:hypothetical protein